MKALTSFPAGLSLVALLAGCAVADAVDHVYEEDDERVAADESVDYRGLVASAGEFSLTPEDAGRYGIVGALRDGKMALLRVRYSELPAGAKRAEIIHYGSYRIVDGELKTVRHFGCSMEPHQPRDFYFEVTEAGEGLELRERSISKLVVPQVDLHVRFDWSLAPSQQGLPVEAAEIGCAAPARAAAAEPFVADIAAMLLP
jgi:hypothetical protein